MTFEPIVDGRPADSPWPRLRWPVTETTLTGRFVVLTTADPTRDGAELFTALDDDVVWAHVAGRPRSAEQSRDNLSARIAQGWQPWVIRLGQDYLGVAAGTVIGTSSYLEVSSADARLEIGATMYRREFWGSAINPDTKLTLLRYAFEQLGAGRVQLKTDVRNHRSQRAISRLGAQYEGTLRRYQRRADETVRDTVLFAIVAEDWPQVRADLEERVVKA